MKFDVSSILFLFGALQCFLLIIGINLKKPLYSDLKKITTILLCCMMLVMGYYVIIFNKLIHYSPYFNAIGSIAWMTIPPLYYLLFKSIHEGMWELSWKHLIFFLIPFLFLLDAIVITLWKYSFMYSQVTTAIGVMDLWIFLFLSSGLYFIGRTILIFQKDKEDKRGNGLIWFSYILFSVVLLYSIIYLVIRQKYSILFETSLIFLFVLFVFALVLRSFKLMSFRNLFDSTKYDKTVLSKTKIQEFTLRLEKLMEEDKPYLTKKLSLNDLSTMSGINTSDLSQLLSIYYRSNYYDFINKYRLDHLETLLLDPSYQQYKIMALAEESGFNSKATFYKVFKAKHQLTPSQFVKKYKN